MKYLQTFSLFESITTGTLTAEQKEFLDQYTRGTWSVNPSTGLVDVQGSFGCSNQRLKSLYGIRFGTVERNFDCDWNKLTTLEGAPQTVTGYFSCCHNQLTSLEGAPQTAEGSFYCSNNQLTTLEGAPQTVVGYFDCDAFKLEPGEWNPTGWLQVLRTGSPEARKLILTLPDLVDWWNSELSKDPARTIQKLAPLWSQMSDELKREIRIPPGYEDRLGMRSEFSDLGLF
jgi:hypothetical protein